MATTKVRKPFLAVAGGLVLSLAFGLLTATASWGDPLKEAVQSDRRTAAFAARDVYRHPYETLQFFAVEPGLAVVEIWPAGGWYTEILAPLLKDKGVYYAAHFAANTELDYFRQSLEAFGTKLAAEPDLYADVKQIEFDPAAALLSIPDGTADRVLTFRNVHNWLRNDAEQTAFELFYKALKPGGILGVVEHRGPPGMDRETMLTSGYMDENTVIALATEAGFVLDGRSEINANPKDTRDHESGVWTLPPSLRLGEKDRDKYLAIGESDRMTLRFVKPVDGDGEE
ncbi:MAG: methyltransferase [Gammaproteobacteria bacterium BRH_c0]|nr:MAG: methyltransferase [Gammaproteobacteria bacterium BRH_c0]